MYELRNQKVHFGKKAIAADPTTFQELPAGFARDATQVFYRGVLQAQLQADSFQVLDEFYVRDQEAVFLVSDRKLKVVKAQSASFEVLGFGYARDAEQAFWRDRTLKTSPAQLRPFAPDLALDGKGVLWQNRRICQRRVSQAGLQARIFARSFYFWNHEGVWFSEYGWEAKLIEGVDLASFEVIDESSCRDLHHFYFRGRRQAEVKAAPIRDLCADGSLKQVGEQMALFHGQPLLDCDVSSLILVDNYPVDVHGVFGSDGKRICRFASESQADFTSVLTRVVERQWQLLEQLQPLRDCESVLSSDPPVLPGLKVARRGPLLELSMGEQVALGDWRDLPGLVSQLWSQLGYGQPFRRFLHSTGYLYPKGVLQIEECLRRGGRELLELAPAEARLSLARCLMTSLHGEQREAYFPALSLAILQECQWEENSPRVTTHLARVKELLGEGVLDSRRPLLRLRAAHELYGLVMACEKTEALFRLLIEPITAVIGAESEVELRPQWLALLDLLLAKIWIHDLQYSLPVAPSLTLLIEQTFNLDLNLARLWEVTGRTWQLDAQLQDLVGERPLSALWGGLNSDYPTWWCWKMAAELRSLKIVGGDRQEFLERFWRELGQSGRAAFVAEMLCEMEDWLNELGLPALEWPEENLYLRIDRVAYLVEQAELRDPSWVREEQGIRLQGWPWGRALEVDLAGTVQTAFVGQWLACPDGHTGPVQIRAKSFGRRV